MSFRPIPFSEFRPDIANIDTVVVPPVAVAEAEIARWLAKEQAEPDMTGLWLSEARLARRDIKRAIGLLEHGYATLPTISKVAMAGGTLAISRLVGMLCEDETSFKETGQTYDGDARSKVLVDYHPTYSVFTGAFSAVTHKNRLEQPPFAAAPAFDDRGEAWYLSEDAGLYLGVKTPAVVSPMLHHDLSEATGGIDAAEAVIDAGNSVTIAPYFSIGYLAAQAR